MRHIAKALLFDQFARRLYQGQRSLEEPCCGSILIYPALDQMKTLPAIAETLELSSTERMERDLLKISFRFYIYFVLGFFISN